jgi:hypothetical protein
MKQQDNLENNDKSILAKVTFVKYCFEMPFQSLVICNAELPKLLGCMKYSNVWLRMATCISLCSFRQLLTMAEI